MRGANFRRLVRALYPEAQIVGDGIGRHALYIHHDRPTISLHNSWLEANNLRIKYEQETDPEKVRIWEIIDLEHRINDYGNHWTK